MSEREADRIGEDELPTSVEEDEGPDVEGHNLRLGPDRAMAAVRDAARGAERLV